MMLSLLFSFFMFLCPGASGWINLDHQVEDCHPQKDYGYYCTEDKKGYKRCDSVYVKGVGKYNGVLEKVECPKGTRCGCDNEDVDCELYGLKMNEICVPNVEPNQYEETFSLKFKQAGREGMFDGDVIRDAVTKRYLKRSGDDYKLIIPDNDGSLTKYHWSTAGGLTCLLGQSTVHKLPYFMDYRLDNIHPYKVLSSTKKNGTITTQKFHYGYNGGKWTGESNERWLSVYVDPFNEKLSPKSMTEVVYNSGIIGLSQKAADVHTRIKFKPSDKIDSKTWATLPAFDDCKEVPLDDDDDDYWDEDWDMNSNSFN